MAAKSTKSKTTGKKTNTTAKKQPEKEKLPAGNQPEMVIVF